MDRAFSSGSSASPPAAPASPSIGYPTSGNSGTGTPATKPGPYWYHMITEELRGIIAAAGLTPTQADVTQLLQALRAAGVFTTPAQFDNTTKAATTAFVQRALGNMNGANSYSVTSAIPASQAGSLILFSGAAGQTLTLPALSTATQPVGSKYTVENYGGNAVTIAAPSGVFTNGGGAATYVLAANTSMQCVFDGSNYSVISGQGQALKAGNGYQKLPSGIIIQWMTGVAGGGGTSFSNTLPIAFPTGIAAAWGIHFGGDATVNITVDSGTFTLGSVGMRSSYASGTVSCMIFAIGY